MSGRIQIERVDYNSGWSKLEPEWDELLEKSVRPTVFATFDYVTTSLRHLRGNEDIFALLFRETGSGKLLAIYPLSLSIRKIHGVNLRVVMHALPPQTTEVDKPCPIIHENYEAACWSRFTDYFKKEFRDWDFINLEELISDSEFPCSVCDRFRFPNYWTRVKPGPDSPVVKLNGDWEDFWGKHRKLRKKCGRLERRIEGFSYSITNDPSEVDLRLKDYIDTEVISWKEGEMVGRHKEFYAELMHRLAEKNRLWFGVIRDGEKVVSVEIAFTYLNKVYFSHGTFSPEYAVHSPGMVNSCWFIKHFHGKGFEEGDYLAGFADYVNPWADRFEHTSHVSIRRMSWKNQYLAAWHMLGKAKHRILRMKKREGEDAEK